MRLIIPAIVLLFILIFSFVTKIEHSSTHGIMSGEGGGCGVLECTGVVHVKQVGLLVVVVRIVQEEPGWAKLWEEEEAGSPSNKC